MNRCIKELNKGELGMVLECAHNIEIVMLKNVESQLVMER